MVIVESSVPGAPLGEASYRHRSSTGDHPTPSLKSARRAQGNRALGEAQPWLGMMMPGLLDL